MVNHLHFTWLMIFPWPIHFPQWPSILVLWFIMIYSYDLIFVIHSIVLLIHLSHAHHSFIICANSFIIAESFPVTVTNHTSQSIVVYICVVGDWELPSFDILGFPLPLLPCRLRTSLENSRRTPSTLALFHSPPLLPNQSFILNSYRHCLGGYNWGSLDSPHIWSYPLCIHRIFCSTGQPTQNW